MPVYIIIVTYNGARWVEKCITSALASGCPVQLIIIDNNSNDNTLDILRSLNVENIMIFEIGQNLGFGQANNLGIKYAIKQGAEYIYLLNQDAYLEPDTISGLKNLMEIHPAYGILSPMQYNGNGSQLDKNFENVLKYRILKQQSTKGIVDVEFVMAAHWLCRVKMLEKVGLFDSIYKLYGEDDDLINRALYYGFSIGIGTEYKGYHDREFRKRKVKDDIKNLYQSLISVLADINYSLGYNLLRLLKIVFKDNIYRLRNGQYLAPFYHVLFFMKIFSKIPQINNSRKVNSKEKT